MRFKVAALQFTVIVASLIFAGAADARTINLVGFGDSLMAGYQLPPGDGFPDQLEAALKAKGLDVTIANAGVSGDTTTGGPCAHRLVGAGRHRWRHPRTWRQ